MIGILPKFFKIASAINPIRVGGKYDGGYIVSEDDIINSDILISLGMGSNWKFEIDFVKKNNVPVNIYDPTVNKKFFLNKVLNSILRFYRPRNLFFCINLYFSYKNFFVKNKKHIEKFVSSSFVLSSIDKEKYCTLNDVIEATSSKNIFLKIDIEGDEYRLLDHIVNYQDRIECLIIEFHNCDINLLKIKNFISKFQLNLIHVHANNYTPLSADDNLPLTLEMTFSKNYESLSDTSSLNSKLDMNNCTYREQILLEIKD